MSPHHTAREPLLQYIRLLHGERPGAKLNETEATRAWVSGSPGTVSENKEVRHGEDHSMARGRRRSAAAGQAPPETGALGLQRRSHVKRLCSAGCRGVSRPTDR